MSGPSGIIFSFVFPEVLMFPETKPSISSRETPGLSGKQN